MDTLRDILADALDQAKLRAPWALTVTTQYIGALYIMVYYIVAHHLMVRYI